MNAVLICPAERPGLEQLGTGVPLAAVPILGQSLVEHWLEHLARKGAKHVRVLAADRPNLVRALVCDGARWGISAEVLPERCELTPEEALQKYGAGRIRNPVDNIMHVFPADTFPGLKQPLFTCYSEFFTGAIKRLCQTTPSDRIGIREIKPGVWVGLKSRIDRTARVAGPCWIGEHVWIGPDVEIGPNTIIEDRVFVDRGATVERSLIGSDTYVGQIVELRNSMAWGNRLINWQTGSSVLVPDEFLLSGFKRPKAMRIGASWPGRIAAILLLQLTVPFGLYALLKSSLLGLPAFRSRDAVLPFGHELPGQGSMITYFEMNSTNRWLKRWPQLWSVACGEFAWVGNRPLKPEYAAQLKTDFDKLWLQAPLGFVSLADVEQCFDRFDEQARAHASYYATAANRRLNFSILTRFVNLLWRRALDKGREELASPVPAPVPESSRITIP